MFPPGDSRGGPEAKSKLDEPGAGTGGISISFSPSYFLQGTVAGQRLRAAFPLLKEPEQVLLPPPPRDRGEKQRLRGTQRSREKERE